MHGSYWKLIAATGLLGLMLAPAALAEDGEGQSRAVVGCAGGAQEFVNTITQNAPTSTASTVFVAIVDTTIAGGASGGAADADTYTVTFGGEADATGGDAWNVQARVSVNGGAFTSINPTGPNTFHRGNNARTNSMTWCVRVAAAASTTFRIEWARTDLGPAGGTANLDDYIVQVQRSN